MKIKSIIKEKYTGKVYDLTVRNHHNYVVSNIIVHNCHEDSTTKGRHGDLLLLEEVLSSLPAGVEIAIGGGNPLAHPCLLEFLYRMKDQGIICNLTVNQIHVERYKCLLEEIFSNDLIKGIGVSVFIQHQPLPNWLLEIAGNNLVYHIIIGVHTVNNLRNILASNLQKQPKILLLGYKSEVGRGVDYYSEHVEKNIKMWFIYVRQFFGECVLSFDNLAIQQLNIKRFLTEDAWKQFYMGDDFTSSMYIDAVKQQYAPTSRSLSMERQDFTKYKSLIHYWEISHDIS